jgi:hypothetical protein
VVLVYSGDWDNVFFYGAVVLVYSGDWVNVVFRALWY